MRSDLVALAALSLAALTASACSSSPQASSKLAAASTPASCATRADDDVLRVGMSLSLFLGETLTDDMQARLDNALDGVTPASPTPAQMTRELDLVREKLAPNQRIFAGEIERSTGTSRRIEVSTVLTSDNLSAMLADCELDVGLITGVEAALVRSAAPHIEPVVLFAGRPRAGDEAAQDHGELLVRTDSPLSGVADLEGQRVAMHNPLFIGTDFLETEVAKLKGQSAPFFKMPRKPYAELADTFGDVIDRKIAAVALTESQHLTLAEEQPGVMKSFKVLARGRDLPVTSMVVNRANPRAEELDTLLTAYAERFNKTIAFGMELTRAGFALVPNAADKALWEAQGAREGFEGRLYWHKAVKLYQPLKAVGSN